MTLEDFFLLLKDYPDAYVLIDSKQYSLRNYQRTLEDYSDYVEIARNAGAGETLDRIIPEIYNEAMFPGTAMLYSFPSYVYSLWQEYSVEELEYIASFCKEKGIPAATVYWEYWSEETEKIFEKNGISLYVYTVNDRDQARRYISQGAEGIRFPDSGRSVVREIKTKESEDYENKNNHCCDGSKDHRTCL